MEILATFTDNGRIPSPNFLVANGGFAPGWQTIAHNPLLNARLDIGQLCPRLAAGAIRPFYAQLCAGCTAGRAHYAGYQQLGRI